MQSKNLKATQSIHEKGTVLETDRILLTGMVFFGHHGVSAEERSVRQKILVDLKVSMSLVAPGKSDKLEDTIDYEQIFTETKRIAEGPPHKLLESLATEIANKILSMVRVNVVQVLVTKANPPITGWSSGVVTIDITRSIYDSK